nr:PfkB family carbohydrate kinase [Sphingomonas sanguinis]
MGSLNMDILLEARSLPENDGAAVLDHVRRCPGGHAGNCAAALAALGVSVRILAAVGEDAEGAALEADLADSGVDTSHIQHCAGVASGAVYIPVAADRHFMLLDRGANDHLSVDLMKEIDDFRPHALVLFDPPKSLIEATARLPRGATSPDIYWCPGAFASSVVAAQSGILDRIDVLLINAVERRALASLLDERSDLEIVTTRGANGAEMRMSKSTISVEALPIEVVDTIGCGDAFLAAYVVAKMASFGAKDRLALGNVYGASVASQAGARGGHTGLPQLLELAARPATSRRPS